MQGNPPLEDQCGSVPRGSLKGGALFCFGGWVFETATPEIKHRSAEPFGRKTASIQGEGRNLDGNQ